MTPPPPEVARLASALQELRARTGLSIAALAQKTPYSRASWGRYVKGEGLPPREAVAELCRLAGEPEARCLALWELAEAAWSNRAATERPRTPRPGTAAPPKAAPDDVPDTAPDRHPLLLALIVTVCAVTVAAVAAGLLLLPDGRPAPVRPTAATTGPRCRGAACEGQDPMAMVCARAPTTLSVHRTASGAWLELRYSRPCGTAWARMWSTRPGDRLEVATPSHTRTARVADARAAASYIYTPMTAAPKGTPLRACFRPARAAGQECFSDRVR
ncbi:DUF2690 domain-containing protein [Streptomyces sp. NPDC057386]|uniref:helix-turn-helix domain-containing protein n=1 Tax=unclassified Streptomyces TaxID=2593676 RepID=UPI00362E8500